MNCNAFIWEYGLQPPNEGHEKKNENKDTEEGIVKVKLQGEGAMALL